MRARGVMRFGPGALPPAAGIAAPDPVALRRHLRGACGVAEADGLHFDFEVGSLGWGALDAPPPGLDALRVGVHLPHALARNLARAGMFEPDPVIAPADVWTPYAAGGGLFGDRRMAHALVGAPEWAEPGLGAGVNVVILDYGLSATWLRRWRHARFGTDAPLAGGWSRYRTLPDGHQEYHLPGEGPPENLDHGHMIARNILSIAPGVRIWDVPLLPDTVLGPPTIAMAHGAFAQIKADIARHNQAADGSRPLPDGPWILVNAWGAFDPITAYPEFSPDGLGYWNDPGHAFTTDMQGLSEAGIDVVFAAGNCGTPGAHPRCGESSIGPGHSITGANAHPAVLTVGAVRADALPIGPSSQGPGGLAARWLELHPAADAPGTAQGDPRAKPDLCAPSHFRDDPYEGPANTGTSAACGVAAGILAALRGLELAAHRTPLPPEAMRAALRATARRGDGLGHDPRLGWGIANLAAARHWLGL